MNTLILPMLATALLGAGPSEYSRLFDTRTLDQATLDSEGFGDKKAFSREDDGLRIKLGVGGAETGWKTPQNIRFGGNFTLTAELRIKTLPKPAQEDGAAFGLSIAFQDINQPDLTFLRLREPSGQEVYRWVDKGLVDPMRQQQIMMQQQMMMMQQGMMMPGGKPPKPPRKTLPASGEVARFELKREGNNVEITVNDPTAGRPRYLGQVYIGPNDIAAVKLFAANRNGAEPVDVLIKQIEIKADRINGLGTTIRTVFEAVTYGEPTGIEDGKLLIGDSAGGGQPGMPQGGGGPVGPPRAARRAVRVQAGGMVLAVAPAQAAVMIAPAPAPAAALAPAAPAVAVPVAPNVQAPGTPPPAGAPGAPPAQATPPPKEPKARIPLDEIESIRFERTVAMTGRFVGQSDFDFTMPHPKYKPPPEPEKPANTTFKPFIGTLAVAQPLTTPNGLYSLIFQDDGDLIEYGPGKAVLFSSKTGGNRDGKAVMQDDGNLVIYSSSGKALWASETGGNKGAVLMIQPNGRMTIDLPDGKSIWVGSPGQEEPKTGPEAKANEPKKEEPKKEVEAKKEEPRKEVVAKKEELKKEAEAKKEEPKKEAEAKKEEPKKESEAKKAEPNQEEPKKPEVADDPNAPPPGTVAAPPAEPKVESNKNGIRDIDIALTGLRPVAIQQITVNCQTDKGPTMWQIDTTGSQAWPLVVRRSGVEPAADLFLEPPAGDCFEKDFTVMVIYQDGQNAQAQVKADKHSDPKLAVDPKAPASPRADSWIHLASGEKLFGKVESIGEDALRLTTPWQDHLDIPLTRVAGIKMVPIEPKESPESFARRLKVRGSEDLLLARTKESEIIAIPGILEGSDADRLLFRYQGKSRKLPIEMVEGIVMAARPEPDQPDVARATFDLPGGVAVTGQWKGLEAAKWTVETSWGQEVNLPAADVQGVKFRGGRVTYLSDLEPSKVDETPFFGRAFPYKRDVSLLGEPLKLDGKSYDRGLAVHSRSSLTFDLNRRYATFDVVVGFDEASKGKGRVDCRIFADAKEIYANPDLRADAPAVTLKLPVEGAEQLRLLVDFGKGQDTGDRVIWANARLTRK